MPHEGSHKLQFFPLISSGVNTCIVAFSKDLQLLFCNLDNIFNLSPSGPLSDL